MPITYDEGEAEGEECPECWGTNTYSSPSVGMWKCEDCSTVWSSDRDDDEGSKLTFLMPHDQDYGIAQLKNRLAPGE